MNTNYTITITVINLVKALYEAGYKGRAEIVNGYPSGIEDALRTSFSVRLSGFSKESLHLVEDTETGCIHAYGRYSKEIDWDAFDLMGSMVRDIVGHAYSTYLSYNDRGYELPAEFLDMFVTFGYLEKRTETVTKYVPARS